MDTFAHLSVLLSIVLGLGITNLLTGLARIVQYRERVRIFWPVILWALVLLVLHVQTWWTAFELRTYTAWTFLSFGLTLIQPVCLFFMSALLMPNFDRDEDFDLQSNYIRNAPWFFGTILVVLSFSLLRTYTIFGTLPPDADVLFHLAFILFGVAGALFPNLRWHRIASIMAGVGVLAYVVLLFWQLK